AVWSRCRLIPRTGPIPTRNDILVGLTVNTRNFEKRSWYRGRVEGCVTNPFNVGVIGAQRLVNPSIAVASGDVFVVPVRAAIEWLRADAELLAPVPTMVAAVAERRSGDPRR